MTNETTEIKTSTPRLLIAGTVAAAMMALTVAGCNTVKGAGQDLEEASDNVKEALSGDDD